MKKTLSIIGIIFILLTISLSGCTEESKFVGTWRTQPILGISSGFVFSNDGTITIDGYTEPAGTWKLEDGLLVINLQNSHDTVDLTGSFNYEFSKDDKTLTLEGTYTDLVLTKQ